MKNYWPLVRTWTFYLGAHPLPSEKHFWDKGLLEQPQNEPGTLPNDRTWPLSYIDSLGRTPCPLAEPPSDVNLYFPCPALPPWVLLYKPVKNLAGRRFSSTPLGAWVSTPELWSMFHVLSCCCSIKSCLLHFEYGLSVFLGPRLSRGLSAWVRVSLWGSFTHSHRCRLLSLESLNQDFFRQC